MSSVYIEIVYNYFGPIRLCNKSDIFLYGPYSSTMRVIMALHNFLYFAIINISLFAVTRNLCSVDHLVKFVW